MGETHVSWDPVDAVREVELSPLSLGSFLNIVDLDLIDDVLLVVPTSESVDELIIKCAEADSSSDNVQVWDGFPSVLVYVKPFTG